MPTFSSHASGIVKGFLGGDSGVRRLATDTVHSVIQAAEAEFAQGDAIFEEGDVFVLGPETRGLPPEVLKEFNDAHRLRLPMQAQSQPESL